MWTEGNEVWVAAGLCGSLVVAIAVARLLRGSGKQYPPGPPGAFLIGNVSQIDPGAPFKSLTNWVAEYGDVYTIRLFGKPHVVVSGYDQIHEALVTRTDDFAGRPNVFRARYFTNFYGGLVFGKADQKWLRLKKLVSGAMKQYGDGKGKLEDITLEIVDDLLTDLAGKADKPHNLAVPIRSAMANIISSIIYAKKLDSDRLDKLMEVEMPSAEMLTPSGPGSELDIMPWLRYLPLPFYRKMADIQRKIWQWFEQERVERQEVRNSAEVECVMDMLLDAQEKDRQENSPIALLDGDISAACIDLIFAGTTTSSSVLLALIALMVTKPDFQDRLRKEVLKLHGRQVQLSDRSSLPYVEAAILETLRYMSPAPIPAPHATTKDTSLSDQVIPANTTVMFNLWNLHHDTRYWEDPWEFRPERYLDARGQLVPPDHVNRQRLLPFAAGRRVCIAEALAKNRLFLFLTKLVQHFKFKVDEESGLPESDPRTYVCGIVLCPKDFKVKLEPLTN